MSQKTDGTVYPPDGLGPFRDGAVHVNAEMCATCIFRPGNLMDLNPGTVARMKNSADSSGTCIVCHENMNTPSAAVCRGYYDSHKSLLLIRAEAAGIIRC